MKGDQIARFFKQHSSTILTCLGAGGVIATSALAVKATPKAMTLLEEAKAKKGEDLTNMEIIKTAAPAYIPAAATCLATITCIFGANALNKKQQAALISAYGLVSNAYREYRKKTEEIVGEETAEQIKEAIIEDKFDARIDEEIIPYEYPKRQTVNNARTVYDMRTGEYYEASLEFATLNDGMEVCIIDWL